MINDDELKNKNPELFRVARERGTETPFTGKFVHTKDNGTYNCAVCGNPLFSSTTKFDSGTGWPSFDEAIPNSVKQIADDSHGMHRIEVVCAKCESHLGHLFEDGPTKTGKRFCLNSVCLDLERRASGEDAPHDFAKSNEKN